MIRSVLVAVPLAFLLAACVTAEEVKAQEVARGGGGGGQGWSQQYHYQHQPHHEDHTYAGLSFDLSSAIVLVFGSIIVLTFLAAVCYPLFGKGGGYGYSGSEYGTYRSGGIDLTSLSEKVLAGIEKAYEIYNKKQ